MASIQSILRPQLLTRAISQQMSAERWILSFMGMNAGGAAEEFHGHGREGKYHTFDNTRLMAKMRAPGTAAAKSARQGVGAVPFVYPRMHDSIPLLAEEIHNFGRIEDPATRDNAGADFISRQTRFLAQKAANWRAALVFGMLRDETYVHNDGDDFYVTFTSAGSSFQINHNMPAGNQSQLDMTGGGNIIGTSWDNASAPIPGDIRAIDAAFQEIYGGGLRNIICNSTLFDHVVNNDDVGGQAGIANPPVREFTRVVGTREDNSELNVKVATLTSTPGITWYITDEGLSLGAEGSESFTKYVPDTGAIFMPEPDSGIFALYQGSEPIAEFDGGPESTRVGFSAWARKLSNPTVTEVFVLDNSLPVNHIPNSVAFGTVVF